MKRVFLTIGSLALVALLGITMVGRSGVDAQGSATPEATGTAVPGESSSADSTQDSAKDTYLATLAEQLGITTEELQTAIDDTNQELGVEGWFNGMGGNGGRDGSHGGNNSGSTGPNRGGSNGNGGRGGNGSSTGGNGMPTRGNSMLRGIALADAANFLGITEDELRTELDGSTFMAIAIAHGKTTDEVRTFLIAQATADIDERLQEAADAAASAPATDAPASESTTTAPATEIPTTAPVLTPAATATT